MNMSIEKMLSHVYEIEGLMLVTRRLGEENTPEVITNKIKRKVGELAEMCGVTLPPAEPVEPPVPEPTEKSEPSESSENSEFSEPSEISQPVEPLPELVEPGQVPVADREPDDDITVEFIEAPDDDEPVADETPADEAPAAPVVNEEPAVQEEPAASEPVVTLPPAPAVVVPPVFCPHDDINDEPVPEPDPAMVPAADIEPDITVEFIEAPVNTIPEPEDEMPLPPAPTEFPEPSEPSEPLRVDQKLQRDLSKDIRKAFSVNDRFRFQRELFAGSANAMNTAIEHIEVMTSYGNAELYFFSQLHWDRDNQDVKDFMEIVRNHFQHRSN